MPYKDPQKKKEAHRQYMREWTKKSSRHVGYVTSRQRELADWILSRKTACMTCPETHVACLEFHHRDPEQKLLNLADAHKWGWSRERIEEEMLKCDVICANCHRKLHWNLRHKS